MSEYPKTITLSDGRTATITRRAKGKDLRMSERLAGNNGLLTDRSFAVLAQVVLINDQPVVMEDFGEMDLDDINAINAALGLGDVKNSPAEQPSPASSNGDSRPLN